MTVKILQRILLLFFFTISTPLQAVEKPVDIHLSFQPDLKNGKRVYEICATCHLPEGWGNSDGGYPQIAGQHQSVLVKQLLDIRSGFRENPAMYPFVQERTMGGYQDMADVVAYIARLPMHPRHAKGPWSDLSKEFQQGKKLYNDKCARCHGALGEGKNIGAIPRLYGQHYAYLLRQLELVHKGIRKVNPAMKAIVDSVPDDKLQKIANYVSWLAVPEDKKAPSLNWRNPDFK